MIIRIQIGMISKINGDFLSKCMSSKYEDPIIGLQEKLLTDTGQPNAE